MNFRISQIHLAIIIVFSMISLIWLHSINKYFLFSEGVSKIEITLNPDVNQKAIPILYLAGKNESQINFAKHYRFKKVSDHVFSLDIDKSEKLRFFRLYFNNAGQKLNLYALKISSRTEIRDIDISNKKAFQNLPFKKLDAGGVEITVNETQSYIEMPQRLVYHEDIEYFYIFPLIIIALISFITFRMIKITYLDIDIISLFGLPILILSIFLPAPIYNIALILVVILNINKFRHFEFRHQKIGIILISFFMIYLLNNLFVSADGYHDMSVIERLLPILFLTFIVPVINNRNWLVFFPISALILGFGFLSTSILDALIYKNAVFLSFDFFTKYLHPIYFSYLLFFSICYIDLNMKDFKKYFLIGILFIFMVFSGSKMVLFFTLIAMFINIVKVKKSGLLAIPLLLILVIFSPLKERFNDILNIEDISILDETHIENPYDARINGLTLRLILWREALKTMNGVDYLVGKGVTNYAKDELSSRLNTLGLTKHLNYNPHNQYVDTFWRTGIFGLICLLLIPLYGIFYGLKHRDLLLVQFSFFMIAVMFSESIFGRVNGIYFFTIVLLMLINSNPRNEHSNHRN